MKTRGPVELNFWLMPNAGFETRRIVQSLLNRFHKANPHIRVKVWVFPWPVAWDRLMTVLKDSGGPLYPDVIQIGSSWTCTLAFLGALRELTQKMGEIDRDNFIPTVFESCYLPHTRKLFAVPWFMDLRMLYYRKDALRAFDLEPEDLETWDSFRRVCRAVTRGRKKHKNLHTLATSGQRGEVLIHDLAPWIWGAGGNFLTNDEGHATFHREDAAEGLRFFFSLMEDGCIPLLGRDRFSSGNFFTGHSVFQFSGAWPLSTVFRKDHPAYQPEVAENFDVAPFPLGPAGRFTYLSSPESQVLHARAIGMLPCRQAEMPGLFARHPAIGRLFLESLTYARILPQVPTLGTLERLFSRCSADIIRMIIDRSYTPAKLQSALDAAAQETNFILSLYG
jgi:multiple sugar transport system substrate-binding protein